MSLWLISQRRGLRGSGDSWHFSSGPSHSGSPHHLPSSTMHTWNRCIQEVTASPQQCSDLWSESYYGGKDQMEVTGTDFTWGNAAFLEVLWRLVPPLT